MDQFVNPIAIKKFSWLYCHMLLTHYRLHVKIDPYHYLVSIRNSFDIHFLLLFNLPVSERIHESVDPLSRLIGIR